MFLSQKKTAMKKRRDGRKRGERAEFPFFVFKKYHKTNLDVPCVG
jgi:hypothetical protein